MPLMFLIMLCHTWLHWYHWKATSSSSRDATSQDQWKGWRQWPQSSSLLTRSSQKMSFILFFQTWKSGIRRLQSKQLFTMKTLQAVTLARSPCLNWHFDFDFCYFEFFVFTFGTVVPPAQTLECHTCWTEWMKKRQRASKILIKKYVSRL